MQISKCSQTMLAYSHLYDTLKFERCMFIWNVIIIGQCFGFSTTCTLLDMVIYRAEYNPDQYLWESEFTLASRKFKRLDLEASTDISYRGFFCLSAVHDEMYMAIISLILNDFDLNRNLTAYKYKRSYLAVQSLCSLWCPRKHGSSLRHLLPWKQVRLFLPLFAPIYFWLACIIALMCPYLVQTAFTCSTKRKKKHFILCWDLWHQIWWK